MLDLIRTANMYLQGIFLLSSHIPYQLTWVTCKASWCATLAHTTSQAVIEVISMNLAAHAYLIISQCSSLRHTES